MTEQKHIYRISQSLRQAINKFSSRVVPTMVISFLLMTVAMSMGIVPEHASWEIGTVATKDLVADRSLSYEDTQATEAKKQEALRDFKDVYVLNLDQFNKLTLVALDSRYERTRGILFGEGQEGQKRDKLSKELGLNFSDANWETVRQISPERLESLYTHTIAITSDVMGAGVKAENVTSAKETILDRVLRFNVFAPGEADLFVQIIKQVDFYPSFIVDKEATQAAKAEVLKSVEPVHLTLQKGQAVVSRGDVITHNQYDAIKSLNYTSDSSAFSIVLGIAIINALVLVLIYMYLRYFLMSYNMAKWDKWYRMVLTIITITTMSYPLIFSIQISSNEDIAAQVGFMAPVAAAGMLVAILIGGRIAVVTLLVLALLIGVYDGNEFFMVSAVVSGIVGIVQTKRMKRRGDLYLAAVYIALSIGLVVIAYGLISGAATRVVLAGLVFAVAGGFLSVVLTIGLLPLFESVFQVTTSLTLLELADPSNPLLRRLMQEAPGTYHHSLFVANLAENAALAIGADGLMVRTASYYHDIGKLKRPAFFSENQFSGENPHQKITPMLSTLIITAHVKDGIALAKEHKLPESIIDCIAQHHGSTTVSYFYAKALEEDDSLKEEDFRYHQRKPQTREAAIIMMADTVEAAVRSKADKLTPGQIEGFIRQLIQSKEADGQFEECDLTFKDLTIIGDEFTRMLTGVYHERIEYPDQKQLMKS